MAVPNASLICSHRCVKEHQNYFDDVIKRIKGARLPIEATYDDGAWHFTYCLKEGRNQTLICDGNTAQYLEKIIDGLVYLYKKMPWRGRV